MYNNYRRDSQFTIELSENLAIITKEWSNSEQPKSRIYIMSKRCMSFDTYYCQIMQNDTSYKQLHIVKSVKHDQPSL